MNDRLPVDERVRVRYHCGGCDAIISMAYMRPETEKIHNRPLCETCQIPLNRVNTATGGDRE